MVMILAFQVEHETGAFDEGWVDVEVAIHLDSHLFADGQSQAVALGEVSHLQEGLEHVLALLFRDDLAGVLHQELVFAGTAFLETQGDVTSFGRELGSVLQQVLQDMGHIGHIEVDAHLGGIDSQGHLLLHHVANFLNHAVAERLYLCLLRLKGLVYGLIEF